MTQIIKSMKVNSIPKTDIYEETALNELILRLDTLEVYKIKENLNIIFESFDLIDSWANRLLFKLSNYDDRKLKKESNKLTERDIIDSLKFYKEIPVISNEVFIRDIISRYCNTKKNNENHELKKNQSRFSLSDNHVFHYYNDTSSFEFFDINDVMNNIITSIKNKKKININFFFENNTYREKIDNFVALIYLYNSKKVTFLKKNKQIEVLLN